MKEFISAAEESMLDRDGGLEFAVDGHELFAHKPTDGQIAIAMASFGKYSDEQTKAAAVIDFFVGILDKPSQDYIIDRLYSNTNPLHLDKIEEILDWMVEEWAARPTQQPSGSTRSQRSGGQKSRPRTQPSTSSRSAHASS